MVEKYASLRVDCFLIINIIDYEFYSPEFIMLYKELALKISLWSVVMTALVFLSPTKLSLALSLILFNVGFEASLLFLKIKNKPKSEVIKDEELYDIYGGD